LYRWAANLIEQLCEVRLDTDEMEPSLLRHDNYEQGVGRGAATRA